MVKGAIRKCKARPEPDSEPEVSLCPQFVPIDPSLVVQHLRKLTSVLKHATSRNERLAQALVTLVSMQPSITNIILLTSHNIGQFCDQFKCKYPIIIPLMANIHNIG